MRICCMAQETQQGLCINLEGWNGERDRREVQKGGDICIPMADSCWCLTKQQNSVKNLSFNKKKIFLSTSVTFVKECSA